jgi:hypothetical protein
MLFGTTDNYNTEATERLHIDYAKDAFEASNRREYITQMCKWLERREQVNSFAIYRAGQDGTKYDGRLRPLRRDDYLPITIAKKPDHARMQIDKLTADYQVRDFKGALRKLLLRLAPPPMTRHGRPALQPSQSAAIQNLQFVQVWNRMRFSTPNMQTEHAPDTLDVAVANGKQFDAVLVEWDGEAVAGEELGMKEGLSEHIRKANHTNTYLLQGSTLGDYEPYSRFQMDLREQCSAITALITSRMSNGTTTRQMSTGTVKCTR